MSGFGRAWVLAVIVFVAVLAAGAGARADTSSEWINTAGSDWTDPTSWSTNPNYPNNGTPAGTDYQAVVDQQGSGAYTITFGSSDSATVDGLTLSAGNATLYQSGGTLDVGSISIAGGNYDFAGGVLSGATISKTSGTFNLLGGTLDDDAFDDFLIQYTTAGGSFSVTDGLSTGGGTLRLSGNNSILYFDGNSQSIGSILLQGRPTTNADTPTAYVGGPNSTGAVTLTINSNATVEGDLSIDDNPSFSGNTLVNNGTLLANLGSRTLTINTTNFVNNTTAQSNSGGDLAIFAGTWSNAAGATISSTGGTLDLYGQSMTNYGTISASGNTALNIGVGTWQNLGTITTTGSVSLTLGGALLGNEVGTLIVSPQSTINIGCEIDNSGNVLAQNAAGYGLVGGTIDGGTVGSGSNCAVSLGNGALNNVFLDTGSGTLAASSLYVRGGLNGIGQQLSGSGTINFDGSQHLNNINVNNTSLMSCELINSQSSGGITLTVDANASLMTQAPFQCVIAGNEAEDAVVNNGTMGALNPIGFPLEQGGYMFFQSLDSVTNNGTFEFVNDDYPQIIVYSTVNQFTNNGTINGFGGDVNVSSGTWINSSTGLMASDGGELQLGGGSPGIGTNNGLITGLNATDVVIGGTWTNNSVISVTGGSMLVFDTQGTNNGTIQLLGGSTLYLSNSFDVGPGTFEGNGSEYYGTLIFDSDPSHYLVSIGGTSQGTNYDFLTFKYGSAELGGDLEIVFANGFQDSITADDVFTIMQAGSITGSFLNVIDGRVETADDYGSFLVQLLAGPNDTEELELSDFEATPEPASVGLVGLGCVVLLGRRSPSTRCARSGRAKRSA